MSSAHNYWRFQLLDTQDTATYYLSITNIEFRVTPGTPEIPSGGTVISHTLSGGSYGSDTKPFTYPTDPDHGAYDGPMTTADLAAGSSWIGYHYTSAKAFRQLSIASHNDTQGPRVFDADYSDDGSSWTTAATFTLTQWNSGAANLFDIPAVGAHAYWRIRAREMQRRSGTLYLREFQFRTTAGTPSVGSTADTHTVIPGGYDATPIFDGDGSGTSTYSGVSMGPGIGDPSGFIVTLGWTTPRTIVELALTTGPISSDIMGPRQFDILCSDDGIHWTRAIRYSAVTGWSNDTERLFSIPATELDPILGSKVNKVDAYGIMQPATAARVPKSTSYAALAPQTNLRAFKTTTEVILQLQAAIRARKTDAYAILGPARPARADKLISYVAMTAVTGKPVVSTTRAVMMASTPAATIRGSTITGVAMTSTPPATPIITRSAAVALTKLSLRPEAHVSRSVAIMMVRKSVDFTWIDDMFKDLLFPNDISYNSVGATRHESDDTTVDSGYSQRTSRWKFPLQEYDVAYGVRTLEQLHRLVAFNRIVEGTVYGFLFEDKLDHTSTMAVITEARSAPPITMLDQYLGTGDGVKYKFQLQKKYAVEDIHGVEHAQLRKITKPQPGTVKVAVNGAERVNLQVDHRTGIVEFLPPAVYQVAAPISIASRDIFGNNLITAPPGTFDAADFAPGRRLVMTGWDNPINNTTADQVILIVNRTTASINIKMPDDYGTAEYVKSNIVFSRHPSPETGEVVTAGFKFHLPVRFNTKRLPITLEEYGLGGATEVKLVELRSGEAL